MFHKQSLAAKEKAEVEVESKQKIIQNDNKDEHLNPSLDIKENYNKDKEKSEVEDESKQKITQDETLTPTVESESVTETLEYLRACPLIAPKLGK